MVKVTGCRLLGLVAPSATIKRNRRSGWRLTLWLVWWAVDIYGGPPLWRCRIGNHEWHRTPDQPLARTCLRCERTDVADVFGWVNHLKTYNGRILRCITCNQICDRNLADWFWNGDQHGQEHWRCRTSRLKRERNMGQPTQVKCHYCGHMVAPRDPFHVHGHNECLCGEKPIHNQYFHDAPRGIA